MQRGLSAIAELLVHGSYRDNYRWNLWICFEVFDRETKQEKVAISTALPLVATNPIFSGLSVPSTWVVYRPIINTLRVCFRLQPRHSSRERFKDDWAGKSSPNLAVFVPVKINERTSKMSEWIYFQFSLGANLSLV